MAASALFLFLISTSQACGGSSSARLLSMDCAESCQDLQNPFLLTLVLEVDDRERVLEGGTLYFRFDGGEEEIPHHSLQLLSEGRLLGQVGLPSTIALSTERFTLHARGKDTQGLFTNEVSLDLQIQR